MSEHITHYTRDDEYYTLCPACYKTLSFDESESYTSYTNYDEIPMGWTCDTCGLTDPDFVRERDAHAWMAKAVKHEGPWNAEIAADAGRKYHA